MFQSWLTARVINYVTFRKISLLLFQRDEFDCINTNWVPPSPAPVCSLVCAVRMLTYMKDFKETLL